MASSVIRVVKKGRDSIFEVFEWPHRTVTLRVHSSATGARATIEPREWRPDDVSRIRQRLAKKRSSGRSGDEKGRVLYVVGWYGLPARLEIVAAALIHVPRRKPYVVYHICHSNRLTATDRDLATGLLVRCAKRLAVSGAQAGGRLHWEVPASDAARLAQQYEFTAAGRKRDRRILAWNPASRLPTDN